MIKKSVVVFFLFAALVANAQDNFDEWESDPLDVLESQTVEKPRPQVPEFQDVDEFGNSADPFVDMSPPAPSLPSQEVSPAPAYGGGFSDASPDHSQEAEFHRIYKTYNEQPTSSETWERVSGNRQVEVYAVQSGDTLSGISSTFFGDFSFWPKIWSLNNDSILNPHEIEPAMQVKFYPGSMDEAPSLAVTTEGESSEAAPAPGSLAKAAPGDAAIIATAPQGKKHTPVLKSLPPSLPRSSPEILLGQKSQMILDIQQSQFPKALEHLEFYIADSKLEGAGKVTGAEMGMSAAGEYQYVFVELNGGNDKYYVVQKNLTEVTDPSAKSRKGQMIEVQGELEVLERVSDAKNIYRAIVRKAVSPVEVGSVLTPGRLPMIDTAPGSVVDGVGAKIMGGQFDRHRTLFGSNSTVFLDAGSNQGLQVGQTLRIYADEKVRNKKTEAVINDRVIGLAKVIRTSPNFATAYVINASDNILLGDYIGSLKGGQARNFGGGSSDFADEFDSEFDNMEAPPASSGPTDSGFDDSDLDF